MPYDQNGNWIPDGMQLISNEVGGNFNTPNFGNQFGNQNTFVGGPNVTNTTAEDQKRLKKEKSKQFWNAATDRETGQYIAGSAGVTQAVGQGLIGESWNPNINMHRPGAKELFDTSATKTGGQAFGIVGGIGGAFVDIGKNWFGKNQYEDTYAAAEQQWKNREESRRRNMLMGNDYTASTMGGGGFPGGYARAKYGGSFDDETIEIEPYEAILTKGKDGKYKKYLETGGGVERHENNGFKTKAPKGAYVFPAQYLKDINRYLETENWSAIDKLKDQMMIQSTAASMANLPYSNQSPAQQKLNEMVKGSAEQVIEEGAVGGEETFTGRYGGKVPQYNMGGMVSQQNPYMSGMYGQMPQQMPNQIPAQTYENGGTVSNFTDPPYTKSQRDQLKRWNKQFGKTGYPSYLFNSSDPRYSFINKSTQEFMAERNRRWMKDGTYVKPIEKEGFYDYRPNPEPTDPAAKKAWLEKFDVFRENPSRFD